MLTLEDFGVGTAATEHSPDRDQSGTAGLHAFDDGYKAGWDDAIRSIQEEQNAISAELCRNLEELSVTFFEARQQVCLSLRPFVEALAEKVLPEIARDHMADALCRFVEKTLGDETSGLAVLVVSQADLAAISGSVSAQEHLDVEVRVEDTFAPGQIRLMLGDECHEVDHQRLLGDVRTAVSEYYASLADETKVG